MEENNPNPNGDADDNAVNVNIVQDPVPEGGQGQAAQAAARLVGARLEDFLRRHFAGEGNVHHGGDRNGPSVRIRHVQGVDGERREVVVVDGRGGGGSPLVRIGAPNVAGRQRQVQVHVGGCRGHAVVGEQRQVPGGGAGPALALVYNHPPHQQPPAGGARPCPHGMRAIPRPVPAAGPGQVGNAAVREQRPAAAAGGGWQEPAANDQRGLQDLFPYLRRENRAVLFAMGGVGGGGGGDRPNIGGMAGRDNVLHDHNFMRYQQAPARGGREPEFRLIADNNGQPQLRRVVAGGPNRAGEDAAADVGRRLPFPMEVMMELDNSSNSSGSDQSESCELMQIECEISPELSEQVFENDMLREMILNHVIFSGGKINTSDLKNIRLVRKSWLTASADSLRKFRLPVFNLYLDSANSTNGCVYVQNHGSKLLETFVRFMTSPTRLPDFIPPFKLHLMPEFFRSENYKDLSDCLISCGEALVELDLSFPVNSSMTFAFHTFYLPLLQRLSVQFSDHRLDGHGHGQVIHNHGHTIYPLQTVLNGTDELKELTFKYTPAESLIPFGFEYLALPRTITKLCMECPVKNSDLQLFIKNDLPNLTSLGLFATNTPYSEQMIFQIFEKYRKQLKSLTLKGHHYQGRVRNTTLFHFPIMEKLEALAVTSQCWEFEEDLTHLERQLPKMKELRMWNTTETMFNKWCGGSMFPVVTKLFVSLINTNIASYNPHHVEVPMTLTLEKMQSIHLAFPNVVSLELTMWGPQTCGLKYLFMEMRSLQKLAITVKGSNEHFSQSHWDALLIGVPVDMATSFRKNPEYWRMVDLKDDNNFPSIRKLTALKSLALVERFCPASMMMGPDGAAAGSSLISDLSFHFAFMKMPNLTTLLLHGKFSPSTQMKARWKEEKGSEITEIRGQ